MAVAAVADRVAAYAANTKRAMEEPEDLGDLSTNDLFTEVSHQVDTDLWFSRPHLQPKA